MTLATIVAVLLLAAGANLAFRFVPWLDPLRRIRRRLPAAPDGRPRCALTFDDGPSPATADILDALGAAGVRATFFVVARNAERYPELLRRAAREGHTIGVHGTTHRTLTFAAAADAEDEIRGAIARITALGVKPAALYRSPKGRKSPAALRVVCRLGLQPWAWSCGLQDTRGASPTQLVERLTRRVRDRMVLLVHDGHNDNPTPDVRGLTGALPSMLKLLQSRGFELVTLDGV